MRLAAGVFSLVGAIGNELAANDYLAGNSISLCLNSK